MSDVPAGNEVEVAKTLMQEYISARQEVILHVQLYKTQARSGAFLIPLTGLLIPLALGREITIPATNITLDPSPWITLVILLTISTVIFHMIFSILALQFAMQILAERCVRLEDAINVCLHGKYMMWERLSQQIWSNRSAIVYNNPDTAVIVLGFIIAIFYALVLPLYALTEAFSHEHDAGFTIAAFVYTWYLFAVVMIAIRVTVYSTGSLRDDCRQIFSHVAIGGPTQLPRSGLWPTLLIAIAAVFGTGLFAAFIYFA